MVVKSNEEISLFHYPCNAIKSYIRTYISFPPGASVEGGVDVDDDVSTETPLQLAAAGGKVEIVELLLSFGASPFLSTLKVDTMSFGSSAQKGCYCALSTAASHGQRKVLHKLVTHPTTLTSQNSGKEVLSLEEILAEGVAGINSHDRDDKQEARRGNKPGNLYSRFSKTNVKKLQVRMNEIDKTFDKTHIYIKLLLNTVKV